MCMVMALVLSLDLNYSTSSGSKPRKAACSSVAWAMELALKMGAVPGWAVYHWVTAFLHLPV